MSHRIIQDLYNALSNSVASSKDPGASGTVVVGTKSLAICECTTAGAETRVLEAAANLVVGVEAVVILDVDGGDLTIESDDGDVVCTAPGDFGKFIVSKATGVNVWRTVATHLT